MAPADRRNDDPAGDARRDNLEAGFQFVLTHDAELLKMLEDA